MASGFSTYERKLPDNLKEERQGKLTREEWCEPATPK